MKFLLSITFALLSFTIASIGFSQTTALAKPSAVQYKWHEQERIMFIHFGVATWLGKEYDDTGKFDLSRINPTELNTDDWCETAKLWGAKQIIFVAKHVGGFCWWQTNTTDYSVKNIPWKNGKGDLLADIAASCKKYGLNLGVYIYPGDVKYGAGIGSGGKTANPDLQEAYNKVFRQQLTEVLTHYGPMLEVWFDGNCIINIDDILEKHASQSVIFQSKKASIRWPGSESGMLAYPAWNSLSSKDLNSGISTQYNDDPNGDAWAPLEADAPLYNHNWFWNPTNEKKRKTVQNLIDMYYKSAGYGGVMLLNASPDTTGKITDGDKNTYRAFGQAIQQRFSDPLKQLANKKGSTFIISFDKPTPVNHVIIEEDYRYGHRIRNYTVEGKINNQWTVLVNGSSVGRKKIDAFATQKVTAIKLTINSFVNTPLIRSLKVYHVNNYTHNPAPTETNEWQICGNWDTKTFKNNRDTIALDLNKFITTPGQYEVKFLADVAVTGTSIDSAIINFENQNTMQSYLTKKDDQTFYINRTSQISANSSSTLTLIMHSDNNVFQNRGVFKIRKRP
ncbi:MAG: alpha-L-fucosidase [Bacteroidetes bacterium]|jgi:alpha-L-fucosidase|nr:alpha-L-fucosidase [Bacteroidota bacterium]